MLTDNLPGFVARRQESPLSALEICLLGQPNSRLQTASIRCGLQPPWTRILPGDSSPFVSSRFRGWPRWLGGGGRFDPGGLAFATESCRWLVWPASGGWARFGGGRPASHLCRWGPSAARDLGMHTAHRGNLLVAKALLGGCRLRLANSPRSRVLDAGGFCGMPLLRNGFCRVSRFGGQMMGSRLRRMWQAAGLVRRGGALRLHRLV